MSNFVPALAVFGTFSLEEPKLKLILKLCLPFGFFLLSAMIAGLRLKLSLMLCNFIFILSWFFNYVNNNILFLFVYNSGELFFMENQNIENATLNRIKALEAQITALKEHAQKEGLEIAQNTLNEEIKIAEKTAEAKIQSIEKVTKSSKSSSDGLSKEWKKAFEEARKAAQDFATGTTADLQGFSESMLSAVFGGGTAGEVASVFGAPILEKLLGSIFQGGGMFADGGRPPVNKASIVGEKGPELFIPDTSGTIVPNDALKSADCVVYQNFTFQSLDPITNMKLLEAQKNQIRDWVVDGIKTNKNGLRSTISSVQ